MAADAGRPKAGRVFWARLPVLRRDAAWVGVAGPVIFVTVLGVERSFRGPGWQPRLFVLALAQSAPLLWRHKAPWHVLAVTVGAGAVQASLGAATNAMMGPWIAVAATVRHQRRWTSLIVPAAVFLVLGGILALVTGQPQELLYQAVAAVAAWGYGDGMRQEAQVRMALTSRVQQLAREHELRAESAALAERARIGRELHGVVGRVLSGIIAHATAARALLQRADPGAATAMQEIEHAGREALSEVDRVLRLLRQPTVPNPVPVEARRRSSAMRAHPRWRAPAFSMVGTVAVPLLLAPIAITDAFQATLSRPTGRTAVIVLATTATGALFGRWRFPTVAAVTVSLAVATAQLLAWDDMNNTMLAVPVAIHAVASTKDRAVAQPFLLAALALLIAVGYALYGPAAWELALIMTVFCVVAWRIGIAAHGSRTHAAALREQAKLLKRERLLQAERAAAAERLAIARELHDSVGHTLSVVVLLSGAARSASRNEQARADEALCTIERSARDALTDVDQLTRLLPPLADERVLPPRLRDLDRLVEEMHSVGLTVELDMDPAVDELPKALQTSVYRVVQEAVTNVLKHAATSRCFVRLWVQRQRVEVIIENGGGPAEVAATASGGRGLLGMRERIALFGGEFEYGPRDESGFAVRASFEIPVEKVGHDHFTAAR